MSNKPNEAFEEKTMELVQLDNGDVVLRDTDKEPVIRISFSDNAKHFLQGDKMDITRAMVEAGIQRHLELLSIKQRPINSHDSGYLH